VKELGFLTSGRGAILQVTEEKYLQILKCAKSLIRMPSKCKMTSNPESFLGSNKALIRGQIGVGLWVS